MTMTDGDEAGKLFVGGLSWDTNKDNLQQYFSQYGEVVDSVVMKNPATGRSRGFGFVTFKDSNCVSLVLTSGPHELDGRTIDPKACTPKSEQQKNKKDDGSPKVFLGGLPPDITETEIRSAFGQYGCVTDVVIMFDQERKKSRGFGFLSYDSEDSVQQVCSQRFVTVNGKQIECKRAEPRFTPRRNNNSGMGGQGYNWSPSTTGFSQGMGAPNGSLSGGYHSYGAQVMQAPYPSTQGTYGGGYQNWHSSSPGYSGGLSNYGQSSTYSNPSSYGQPGYSAYGASGDYNYSGPSAAASQATTGPSPGANPPLNGNPPPMGGNPPPSGGNPSAPQSNSPYGYGSHADGHHPSSRNQSGGPQSYHPYRR